jgi:hypothetical protein
MGKAIRRGRGIAQAIACIPSPLLFFFSFSPLGGLYWMILHADARQQAASRPEPK